MTKICRVCWRAVEVDELAQDWTLNFRCQECRTYYEPSPARVAAERVKSEPTTVGDLFPLVLAELRKNERSAS